MARFATSHRSGSDGLLLHVVALGLVLMISTALVLSHIQATINARTNALVDEMATRADSAFITVSPLSADEYRRLRTYLNKEHVQAAKALGIDAPATRAGASDLADAGALKPLTADSLYYVEPMKYSVPYVTASMANLLERIGLRFQEALRQEGLPPYRFVITSATRSKEDQRALRRVNSNAVSESSHNYGTTVDLHYREFYYASGQDVLPAKTMISTDLLTEKLATAYANLAQTHHEKLEALLGRILIAMQQEGKVMVIYERNQPVFHITVADEIEPPKVISTPLTLGP